MPTKHDKFAEKHEQGSLWFPAEIGLEEEKTEGGIVWSFSINRIFKQCQRQWFYKKQSRERAGQKGAGATRGVPVIQARQCSVLAWKVGR